jgi:cytochrome c553
MGAGHFEGACRPCHGSPGLAQPRVARAMTPHPPDLAEGVLRYEPAELFYIVKHGIKFTGMPAWPAQQRDDEVWAMVAFLRRLPAMDPREYERLARGPAPAAATMPIEGLVPPPQVPRAVRENCSRCHGIDGRGRGAGAFPILAGQRADYLRGSLAAYARGQRHSGMMEPIAAGLRDEEIREIADYYASRTPSAADAPGAAASTALEDVARGRRIAHDGIPERLVPACVSCHGPSELPRNPNYPHLAGQPAPYIRQQLALFKGRARGGTPYQFIMQRVATQLSEDDMRAVAAFFASLPADGMR